MIIKKNNKNYIIPNPTNVFGYNCYLCGKPAEEQHHCIGGMGKRKISDRERLTVALCSKCHYGITNHIKHYHYKDKKLKAMAQQTWLKSKGGDTKENRQKWYEMYYKFYDL